MADSQRKTANLFDGTLIGGYFTSANFNTSGDTAVYKSIKVYLLAGTYTFSWGKNVNVVRLIIDGNYSQPVYTDVTSHTITSTTDGYVGISFRDTTSSSTAWDDTTPIMLNEGTTAKPYEPYGWVHSLRKLGTSTDTITTLPADLYADGNNATVGLVGNMYQASGVSPDNPIQPQETGERTGNLCSSTDKSQTAYLRFYIKDFKEIVDDYDTFSLSFKTDVSLLSNTLYLHTTGNEQIAIVSGTGKVTKTFTLTSTQISNIKNATEPYIYIYKSNADFSNSTEEMINTGDTALPYEPYGYKIPISSANTTTPVYLGEVESTRQIKKLVLSSSQNWQLQSINSHGIANFYITLINDFLNNTSVISNYFTRQTTTIADTTTEGMLIALSTNTATVYIRINSQTASTAQEFKNWLDGLSEEVAIWYVLATEETAVVNEPLRKIGDYADTVSGITIPTITGKDTFDVLTTLKPSEVSLSYTGWHDATVKEWEGSEWQ